MTISRADVAAAAAAAAGRSGSGDAAASAAIHAAMVRLRDACAEAAAVAASRRLSVAAAPAPDSVAARVEHETAAVMESAASHAASRIDVEAAWNARAAAVARTVQGVVPALAEAPPAARHSLGAAATVITGPAGRYVYAVGERVEWAYVVLSGEVSVYWEPDGVPVYEEDDSDEPRRVLVRRCGAGDVIGEFEALLAPPCQSRLHSAIASKTASLARLPFEDLLRCWPDEGLGTWWSRLAHAYDLARGESYVPRARGARWPVQQPGAASDAARRMLAGLYYATAPLVVAPGDVVMRCEPDASKVPAVHGDEADVVYFVRSGECAVHATESGPPPVPIAALSPSAVFSPLQHSSSWGRRRRGGRPSSAPTARPPSAHWPVATALGPRRYRGESRGVIAAAQAFVVVAGSPHGAVLWRLPRSFLASLADEPSPPPAVVAALAAAEASATDWARIAASRHTLIASTEAAAAAAAAAIIVGDPPPSPTGHGLGAVAAARPRSLSPQHHQRAPSPPPPDTATVSPGGPRQRPASATVGGQHRLGWAATTLRNSLARDPLQDHVLGDGAGSARVTGARPHTAGSSRPGGGGGGHSGYTSGGGPAVDAPDDGIRSDDGSDGAQWSSSEDDVARPVAPVSRALLAADRLRTPITASRAPPPPLHLLAPPSSARPPAHSPRVEFPRPASARRREDAGAGAGYDMRTARRPASAGPHATAAVGTSAALPAAASAAAAAGVTAQSSPSPGPAAVTDTPGPGTRHSAVRPASAKPFVGGGGRRRGNTHAPSAGAAAPGPDAAAAVRVGDTIWRLWRVLRAADGAGLAAAALNQSRRAATAAAAAAAVPGGAEGALQGPLGAAPPPPAARATVLDDAPRAFGATMLLSVMRPRRARRRGGATVTARGTSGGGGVTPPGLMYSYGAAGGAAVAATSREGQARPYTMGALPISTAPLRTAQRGPTKAGRIAVARAAGAPRDSPTPVQTPGPAPTHTWQPPAPAGAPSIAVVAPAPASPTGTPHSRWSDESAADRARYVLEAAVGDPPWVDFVVPTVTVVAREMTSLLGQASVGTPRGAAGWA